MSLAAEDRPEAGREGDGVEKVLEKLGGVLGFSFSHVGSSLEGVCEEEFVLVLVTSGGGMNLETGVRVAVVIVGDSDLKDGRKKVSILLTHFLREGQSSTVGQSESKTRCFLWRLRHMKLNCFHKAEFSYDFLCPRLA